MKFLLFSSRNALALILSGSALAYFSQNIEAPVLASPLRPSQSGSGQQQKTRADSAKEPEARRGGAPLLQALPAKPAFSALREGTQLLDRGSLEEALAFFQDYCRRIPSDPSGYFWTAICYDEMGNNDFALDSYRSALSLAAKTGMDSAEIRVGMGNSFLKSKDIEKAIESYTKALEINPQYGLAQLNLGRAYLEKSDFQSALTAFSRCDELGVRYSQLPYYRARALLGLGRKDECKVVVEQLLQKLPDEESKAELTAEFASCLSSSR